MIDLRVIQRGTRPPLDTNTTETIPLSAALFA